MCAYATASKGKQKKDQTQNEICKENHGQAQAAAIAGKTSATAMAAVTGLCYHRAKVDEV